MPDDHCRTMSKKALLSLAQALRALTPLLLRASSPHNEMHCACNPTQPNSRIRAQCSIGAWRETRCSSSQSLPAAVTSPVRLKQRIIRPNTPADDLGRRATLHQGKILLEERINTGLCLFEGHSGESLGLKRKGRIFRIRTEGVSARRRTQVTDLAR